MVSEELIDVSKLRMEQSIRRFRALVIVEIVVIVGLAAMLSEEYQNNQYMRQWVQANFWPADFFLNGYFVTAVAGMLVGLALASYRNRRSRDQDILEALRRLI
jgi:hypothetical protein